ncbi:MAG TPA: 50S ribosomal protein L11 methyltransferase [Bacteroidales bacterium]|nr:50S ribosomal protein L11 methyltransferase [Bacteroidales bacterium]
MNYIEISFSIEPQTPFQDMLISELAEIGFESFEETETELLAYIQEPLFDEKELSNLNSLNNKLVTINYSVKQIPAQNWNALWESNYDSVTIDNRCYIRAPFHPSMPEMEFEILIEPQMSFGTAHHETTANMISYLLEEEVSGKSFLDMGCGTAVLAILAHKKGASPVCAIDNDEWAYKNSIDNIAKNNTNDIQVFLGDAVLIEHKTFEIIFANINKNILLADIEYYTQSLSKNGLLFMSGFYKHDLKDIQSKSELLGLKFISYKEKNSWVAAKFKKIG